MEYYMYTSGNELAHHGIRGMKWGVRRFQNKDGSLTAAGKKRRASEEADLKEREKRIKGQEAAKAKRDKLDAKKAELDARERALKNPSANKPAASSKPKSISEMNDDELRNHINRMMLEKQYYDTRKSLATANPPQVSKGKKFMNSVMNDVVAPAAKEAGRKWLTNFMEDKLGLNKKTELQRLEDTWKKMDYKKKISDLKKGINDNEDPYGLKDAETLAKRAKAEYEVADYADKKRNVGKAKEEKTDWDSKNKEQQYYKEMFKTEKARRDYEAYLRDKETLGDEEAWERYKKKQGGN